MLFFNPDFVHLRQSLSFLSGSFGEKYRTIVGKDGAIGVRFSFWIFAVEYYTGDIQPTPVPFNGARLVIWDRVMNEHIPKGWKQMIKKFQLSPCAIVDVSQGEYWNDWTKTLRQYRRKWETQDEYAILEIDSDEFAKYYRRLGRPRDLAPVSVTALLRHIKESKDKVKLYVLQNNLTKEVLAGIGIVDVPEVNQSYYLLAFLDKGSAPPASGLWLINNWFINCKKSNIRFANLGVIWRPGESKGWKGFSEFKLHFHPCILEYKLPLFRITFSIGKQQG